MIADIADFEDDSLVECDVCVVGSGAAGLALASELASSPLSVVLLESGGEEDEPESQALYDAQVSGLRYTGARDGRFRVFGGATTRWGGQALPLTALDFEPRAWVSHSGWPIGLDALAPYYARACRFLRLDDLDFERDPIRHFRAQVPVFDTSVLHYHYAKWSPTPDLRRVERSAIAAARNLTLILHANVTEIRLDEDHRRVIALEARSLRSRRLRVRARHYVLSCGGLETARLLLANRSQQRSGIGNGHDLVGRFLQDHPGAEIGYVVPRDEHALQRTFNLFHRGRVKYSVRCSATPALQREAEILNVSGGVMFLAGNQSPYESLRLAYHKLRRRQVDAELARHLGRCVVHARHLARPAFDYYVRRRTFTPGAKFPFVVTMEQEPNPQSRVTLSDDVDALGMPKLRVNWQLTDLTRRTLTTFAQRVREQFELAGIGTIALFDWVVDGEGCTERLADHYHHIGTTRIHESPRNGVVDAHLRVHGVDNLHVASSAVFPTSGHSNPTLTLLALCMRLADRLEVETSRPTRVFASPAVREESVRS